MREIRNIKSRIHKIPQNSKKKKYQAEHKAPLKQGLSRLLKISAEKKKGSGKGVISQNHRN